VSGKPYPYFDDLDPDYLAGAISCVVSRGAVKCQFGTTAKEAEKHLPNLQVNGRAVRGANFHDFGEVDSFEDRHLSRDYDLTELSARLMVLRG